MRDNQLLHSSRGLFVNVEDGIIHLGSCNHDASYNRSKLLQYATLDEKNSTVETANNKMWSTLLEN